MTKFTVIIIEQNVKDSDKRSKHVTTSAHKSRCKYTAHVKWLPIVYVPYAFGKPIKKHPTNWVYSNLHIHQSEKFSHIFTKLVHMKLVTQ